MEGEVTKHKRYYYTPTIINIDSLRPIVFHSKPMRSSFSILGSKDQGHNYKIESLMMKNEDITSRYISLVNKVESIREFIIESLNKD